MMSEEGTEATLKRVYDEYDKIAIELDKIPKDAEKHVQALLDGFAEDYFSPTGRIAFRKNMKELAKLLGHASHIVLAIELARQAITPEQLVNVKGGREQQASSASQQPIIVAGSQVPQLGVLSGGWYYAAEKKKAEAAVSLAKLRKDEPQISTSKPVIDILEFGRQLIPELINKTYKAFHRSLDHLYFFSDENTKERLTNELEEHLTKLSNIVLSFSVTIAEYRKELCGERKRDVAKALVMMKMAEAQSLGGMPISRFYQMLREGTSPEDAGESRHR